jgi:3-hydroxybutyryl-CoA dehydrogenase
LRVFKRRRRAEVIERIGVVGAGIMGGGISQMFAEQGKTVLLWDADKDQLARGFAGIERRLKRSVAKGHKTPEVVEEVLGRISPARGPGGLTEAELVIEAITENKQAKQQVLFELSGCVGAAAILATNTSSLSIEELSAGVRNPQHFLGMHFFNPPTKLELVELVPTTLTSTDVIATAIQLLKDCGKTPVTVKDTPGFIVNRLLLLMVNEAARMLDEGVAAAEDIDTAMKLGALHPVGPLALADLIGLDTCETILSVLHDKLGRSAYSPAGSLRERVAEGKLGRKTGEGFFATEAGG